MIDLQTLAERPVFICGHPKSGTTLVRALVDDHPELVVFPEETSFFRTVMPILSHRVVKTRTMLISRQLILRSFPDVPLPEFLLEEARAVSDLARPELYALMRMHQQAEWIGEQIGSRHFGDGLASAILAFGQVYGKLSERSRYWVERRRIMSNSPIRSLPGGRKRAVSMWSETRGTILLLTAPSALSSCPWGVSPKNGRPVSVLVCTTSKNTARMRI